MLLKAGHKLPFKGGTQHPYRVEVFSPFTYRFQLARKRESRCGDQAVEMWVQTEVLTPGMKDTNGPASYPIMAIAEGFEGIPYHIKQVVVKPAAVQQADDI
jgi:hypothetical protein